MKLLPFALTALSVFGAQTAAWTEYQGRSTQTAAAQLSPRPIDDILVVQPFTLQQPFRNSWSKERATVSSGVVVVLAVNPALAARRNSAEPILYAGTSPIQRLNDGGQSGRVIGMVPGAADLSGVPIWFGRPGLPERVTADTVRAERAAVDKSGIRPFSAEKLRSVTRPSVSVADQAALLRDHVAPLVLEFSPQEKELADTWRLPVATAPPTPR
jgi:hypothetical protein